MTTNRLMYYSLLFCSFFVPFFVQGPQFLTGTVVNTFLFLFVSQFPSKKTFPIVVLPSVAAVLNGVLFGKFTIFLLYFLPFIWMGNYILTKSFTYFSKKNSFFVSVLISSLLKFSVLFIIANIFTSMKIVPSAFLQSMGLIQLYTALIGGILALGISAVIPKNI